MQITVNEIISATGGTLLRGRGDTVVAHIALDSRRMAGDDIFVPIIGEKTDGHRFIAGAFELGAAATFTSRHDERSAALVDQETHAWIRVDDTVAALQALGSYLRERFNMPFVGVTGSVGKTSTREMIVCALASQRRVTATAGNSNSQVGVPLTLSLMDEDADVAVMELGMSMPGEMERIARVGRPNIAVMTNIGVSHIEQLGTQENILREKLHITDCFDDNGIMIVNGDDPLLRRAAAAARGDESALPFPVKRCRVLTYGFSDDCDYRRSDYSFTLRVPGRHNEQNALAALAVCDVLGVDKAAAVSALESYAGTGRRLEFIALDGFTVIDDSYNASPDSMRAALQVLADTACEGRRIAVLADMLELGPDSPRFHREVGQYAAGLPIDAVYTVGELMRLAAEPVQAAGIPVSSYADNASLAGDLIWGIGPGDVILLKGSNGMHLGEILTELRKFHCTDN